MPPLATIGALVEVTPWDELQHWPDAASTWEFIDDRTPFRFRVAGRLTDRGQFFGLYGPIESGPACYATLICNIMLRHNKSDWFHATECGAGFKVAPTVAKRTPGYDPAMHSDIPFFLHPDGTFVDGFPRTSRFGGVRVVEDKHH